MLEYDKIELTQLNEGIDVNKIDSLHVEKWNIIKHKVFLSHLKEISKDKKL